jgi:hypothetical protein
MKITLFQEVGRQAAIHKILEQQVNDYLNTIKWTWTDPATDAKMMTDVEVQFSSAFTKGTFILTIMIIETEKM